ncbi:NUDIX hydrolase [Comamonas guangdongensis]|uniref:NrtR DNA-binding winged helix domain-containing protein n=1 Tax=Comamonas guangdongensis TaxID=510515 RepID=A0ABV3ZUQ2_9BURK
MEQHSVQADLVAVLIAVTGGQPRILTTSSGLALPAGPFTSNHRSLQISLRAWVEKQTHHPLGFVEQLYTFADRERSQDLGTRAISISYLALTREFDAAGAAQPGWQDWYRYFPWEDWREGMPELVAQQIAPALRSWADAAADSVARSARWQRAAMTFGLEDQEWNEELVLQRYELLFEAGLVAEAWRDGVSAPAAQLLPGAAMSNDHRRILATGIARLRAKIKYRPVVFELMPDEFSLLQLQQTVEALAGRGLHKQNFRRLIEQQALVEETGQTTVAGAGRPAKLFRFRRNVMLERAIAGNKLPLARTH